MRSASKPKTVSNHLKQAKHNEEFLTAIETNFAARFADWSITVIFYAALHIVHALAKSNNRAIGSNHREINENLSPFRQGASMPLPENYYNAYIDLYRRSKTTRYDFFLFPTSEPDKERYFQEEIIACKKNLASIKDYAKQRGLS